MSDINGQKPHRRKGLTSITLHWIAEKLRRTERIKAELAKGTYQIDSAKVAQALMDTSDHENCQPRE